MKEIVPGIYAIGGLKLGRSYLIEDHEGLTLVDTSSPSALEGILHAIAAIGRRVEDLRAIVATHYHFDHTGNAGALRERSGAKLCAHADDAPYIDGRRPWQQGFARGPLRALSLTPDHYTLEVDRTLQEGDVIDAAGGLRVIHAPGHTPGSIALYSAERSVLFGGDAFMNVGGLHLTPRIGVYDIDEAKRSIAKLAALEFEYALPGHGGPVISRASEKIGEWSRRWFTT